MLLPALFCLLIGSLAAYPEEDFRSNIEFLEYNTNLDDPNYRLKDSVYPHTMDVDLDVNLAAGTFNGIVVMGVEVREAGLRQIVFHQNVVSIAGVNIVSAAGAPVGLQFPDPYETDSYYEILKINLASPIAVGNYTITVRYTGVINESPIDRGFYLGYYFNNNNEERRYATTQFQPYHARKAFPCFDEPQFKSVYVISITRDRTLSQSYSNMPIARTVAVGVNHVREIFHPTPIISAYLVAFHVSDFVETGTTSVEARPFKIISRPGVNAQHQWAADIGLKITIALDDYFGIQYHEMGQGILMKNDHIALPDFPSGAMENWGMVNYREAYLLYDENHTNLQDKIFIATIMAHELAHKWFGNLVTCFWWSNLWLNESFASLYEHFGAHWADPSLELDDQFLLLRVQSALAADAGSGATPMNWQAVADNPSISAHFSTTSYAKGASVLRMLEHFIGYRNFRSALRYYLRDNSYEIGTPELMYSAFRRAIAEDISFQRQFPNVDIGTVFESWVENPGAPFLDVTVNSGSITVTQRRYQLTGTRPDHLWHIPLTWTHGGAPSFESTTPTSVLSTRSTTITHQAGDNWVIFNIQQSGLYRVNYDDDNWANIGDYLKSINRERIHKLNRGQIVNDLLYFIRSGDVNHTLAFDVLDYLRHETDYYVWNSALGQLDFIRRRLEHMENARIVTPRYLLGLLRTVIQHLGYEEGENDTTSTILNRMQIMNYACNLGHEGCVEDALSRWTAFRANPNELVPPNLRRYVYCVGVREGDQTDYQWLLQRYQTSQNTADMVVMLRALACTKHEASILDYLRQSLDNRRIRLHDRTNAFSFALQGNEENVPIVLNFLYQNFEEIRTKYGGEARLQMVINAIPAHLTDYNTIVTFQNWVYTNEQELAGSFPNAVAAVNTAMANLQWGSDNALEIYNFMNERSSSTTFVASTVLLLAALFVQLLR